MQSSEIRLAFAIASCNIIENKSVKTNRNLKPIQHFCPVTWYTVSYVHYITPLDEPAPEVSLSQPEAAHAASEGTDIELGEDMLQMALRMAEMPEEPMMDLEDSVNPTPIQPGKSTLHQNSGVSQPYTNTAR